MAEEDTGELSEKIESSGGIKKNIIIIVLAVLLLIIIAVVAYLLLGSREEEEVEAHVEEMKVDDEGPLEAPVFLKLGTFSVVLKNGKYNFRVGLQLMMSNEPAKFYLSSRIPLVKDLLLETLPEFTPDQLKTEEGRDKMRAQVIEKLSTLFPMEIPGEDAKPLKKLLFDEFVVTPLY